MPVIKNYNSQVRQAGAIDTRRVSAEEMGAGLGRAVQGFGQVVGQVGQQIQQREVQSELSELNSSIAKTNETLAIDLQETIRTTKPGDKVPFEKYNERVEAEFGKLNENVKSREGRQYLDESSAKIKGQLARTSYTGQAELAGIKAVEDYKTTINSLSNAAISDPSSLQLQRELHAAGVDQLVASGQLPASKGMELKSEGDERLVKASVRGWINLDAEFAKKKITSGEFDKDISGEVKAQLIGEAEQGIRGKEIDKERALRDRERVLKEQQTVVQNDFLKNMQENKLTAKDILASNLDPIGSGSKEQFLQMLKKHNSSEGRLQDDAEVVANVFTRIHLPDGDPNKITNENDLNKFVANGMSFSTLDRFRKEVQGGKTEKGRFEMELKKNVLDSARNQLTKSNPMMGIKDPYGDEQYQKFLINFHEEWDKQKAAGISVIELTNPDSPNYLGKSITQYQRSTKQIMQERARRRSLPSITSVEAEGSPNARLPNESPAAYLKRIKETAGK